MEVVNVAAEPVASNEEILESVAAAEPAQVEEPSGPSERELQLEQDNKALAAKLRAAENATAAANLEKKRIERAKMTDEERLADREKGIAEREKELNLLTNRGHAKETLAGLGIAEADLEYFVSEDKERTLARCQYVKDFITKRDVSTKKSVTEEIMKNTPIPPAGGDKNQDDPFIEAFKKG